MVSPLWTHVQATPYLNLLAHLKPDRSKSVAATRRNRHGKHFLPSILGSKGLSRGWYGPESAALWRFLTRRKSCTGQEAEKLMKFCMFFRRKSVWRVLPRNSLEMTHPSQSVKVHYFSSAQTYLSGAKITEWSISDTQGRPPSKACAGATWDPSSAVSDYEDPWLSDFKTCKGRCLESSTSSSHRAKEHRIRVVEAQISTWSCLLPWPARISSQFWPQICVSALKPARYLPHLAGLYSSDWHCWTSNHTPCFAEGYGFS